jgi:AGZA family xanthine/uracil permease-like MFS transporter
VTTMTGTSKPRLWVPGDWNAFFGLGTNVLLNVLVLSGLALFVVGIPNDTVVGRILPALAIALPLGNLFYAYLAYRLARQTGRDDVTAMPYGPSVPHYFFVTFVIMLPIVLRGGSPIDAWMAGLAWAFIVGVIILIGAFVGPAIRRFTPRAAMLGTLAGISIAFISMRPAFQMFEVAWIALPVLAIILLSWTAGVRMPGGVPGGLLAVVVGTVIGWVAYATGAWTGMDPKAVGDSFAQFGIHLPVPGTEVISGLSEILPLLVTAIPLGIYNFTEAMNNVESASAAGDDYNLRHILLADGGGAVIGSFLGSPFPPAVYIGHPGWKAVGGRIGYSLATGVAVAAICLFGLVGLFLAVIPIQALVPILLFIGLVIGAQAFTTTPARHAPAVVLAMLPNIASWAQGQIDGALGAAGTSAATVGAGPLNDAGVTYEGMAIFGGGAVVAGLVLGAIAVFIIDREYSRAIVYSVVGAILAVTGFIHASQLIVSVVDGAVVFGTPNGVFLGYLFAAVVFWVVAWREGRATSADFRAAVTTPPPDPEAELEVAPA